MKKGDCEPCGGTGRKSEQGGRYLARCLPCNGTGKKKWKTKRCPSCNGQGYNQGGCVECFGTGELVDDSP